MDNQNTPIQPELKNRKLALVAIIFGLVCFILSGLCTGISAISEYGKPPPDPMYGLYFTSDEIIVFGAFGFIPAAILILLGWIVKKRGSNIWLRVPIALISVWLVFVLFFSITLLTDYF